MGMDNHSGCSPWRWPRRSTSGRAGLGAELARGCAAAIDRTGETCSLPRLAEKKSAPVKETRPQAISASAAISPRAVEVTRVELRTLEQACA